MPRDDVVIIGAGMAGLAAAQVLAAAGRNAVVLEARDRIGGRILTIGDTQTGAPIEMGAEFIHGRPAATWNLVHDAGAVAYDVPFDNYERRNGRLVHAVDFTDTLRKAMSGLSHLGRRDMSFAEYLQRHRSGRQFAEARRLAKHFVEGFDAADPARISAKSLAEEQEGIGDFDDETQHRLVDGYGALVEYLRNSIAPNRVQIELNMPVREIRWAPTAVEVECESAGQRKVFWGARAIVTLPLGVLQQLPEMPGAVRFSPDITAKRRFLSQLCSGPVVKAVLTFREAFWEDAALAKKARADRRLMNATFLHIPEARFPTWWTMHPLRLPILTAWAGGPKASALSGQSEKKIAGAAIESLSSLFGLSVRKLTALLGQIVVHDWLADPWSRGAYSYVAVGGSKARKQLAQPIDGTLFFAGEATDNSGQASTVAGAILSGRHAAQQVLEAD